MSDQDRITALEAENYALRERAKCTCGGTGVVDCGQGISAYCPYCEVGKAEQAKSDAVWGYVQPYTCLICGVAGKTQPGNPQVVCQNCILDLRDGEPVGTRAEFDRERDKIQISVAPDDRSKEFDKLHKRRQEMRDRAMARVGARTHEEMAAWTRRAVFRAAIPVAEAMQFRDDATTIIFRTLAKIVNEGT